MRLCLTTLLLLVLVGSACGPADPSPAPSTPSPELSIRASPPADVRGGAVRVRAVGRPLVEDGQVHLCPGADPCAGVAVTGAHAAEVRRAADRRDVLVRLTGWYDGATLAADTPPEVLSADELDPPYDTPCAGVEGTPHPGTQKDPELRNPPEAVFDAARGWVAAHRDRYAALWWDDRAWAITLLVTDTDVAPVRAELARRIGTAAADRPGGDVGVCVVGGAPATEDELEAASDRIGDVVDGLGRGYGIDAWAPDPRRGSVQIWASHMDRATIDRLRGGSAVPVEVWAFLTVLDGSVDDLPTGDGTGGTGAVPLDTNDSRAGGGMQALGSFTVRYDARQRCVYLDDGHRRVAALWPFGYTARADPLRIVDARGAVVLREGDQFRSGGGFVPTTALDHPCGADGDEGAWIMSDRPDPAGSR